eukprot:COSAG04_NODE_965_length_9140_cov_5.526048_11_plen_77_part_00
MGEKWGRMGKKWVRNEITGLQKTVLMHASAHQAATKRGGTGAIPSAADIARYEREGGPLRPEIRELLGDAAHQSTN